jgi:hypothetical protein
LYRYSKGTDAWIPSDLGTVKYNGAFDPSTAASQAWIMQTYERLKTAPCDVDACSLVGGGMCDCFPVVHPVHAHVESSLPIAWFQPLKCDFLVFIFLFTFITCAATSWGFLLTRWTRSATFWRRRTLGATSWGGAGLYKLNAVDAEL